MVWCGSRRCAFGSYRTDGLVALLDEVLQLSQHRHLCVLQLQLLCGSVRDTGLVGSLGLIRLQMYKPDYINQIWSRFDRGPEIQPESSQISVF